MRNDLSVDMNWLTSTLASLS